MARLTALEIKKKEFQQKMRGFDPDEVQAFLTLVSEEFELLTTEKQASDELRTTVEQQLTRYLDLESTLERTLVAAQQTAVKMETQAKHEAELILREADLEREKRLNGIRAELDHANSDLLRLRSEYASVLTRLRATLEGFGRFLQSVDDEKR